MIGKRPVLYISLLVILMVTIPFIYATLVSNEGLVFGGFLINPIDGNSYLAKMYQGYRGDLKFLLPYSSTQGDGAYLFMFYLAIGHLARLSGLPLLLMFHIFRVLFGGFLMWTIWELIKAIFENQYYRILGYSLSVLGSGLGWIAILFGKFSSDFWVSEGYPFLSIYTNPHFSFGLGLFILALIPSRMETDIPYLILGLLLGIVQPFAVVILLLVLFARTIMELVNAPGNFRSRIKNNKSLLKLIFIGLSGGGILFYQYWTISTDPILSVWNNQNVTKSPDLLDLTISFSPCLILAFFGMKRAWKTDLGKTLVFWALISIILVFVPWNLQRRFLTGLFIPLAGLTVFGITQLTARFKLSRKTLTIILFFLVIPTNLIVVFSGINAVAKKDSQIYLNSSIINATKWIESFTDKNALILADKNSGLLIPAKTGRRVIYGHPFETINSEKEELFVEEFFTGKQPLEDIQKVLEQRRIDYVLSTIVYSSLNQKLLDLEYPLVYEKDDVVIYKIK